MTPQTTPQNPVGPGVSQVELLQCLPTLPSEMRSRALSSLLASDQADIRRRALAIATAVLDEDEIEAYLRNDADAVLRNGALEALKLRGRRGTRLTLRLLRDEDPDMVLQAVLSLTHGRDPACLEELRTVLHHEDPNIVQAAVIAIGQIGDQRYEPDILPLLNAESWIQMAAIQALGDLGTTTSLDHLEPLIDDPAVGPMAAEAMARIGGEDAFRRLGQRWLVQGRDNPDLVPITLLAYVAEALDAPPPRVPGLRRALENLLDHDDVVEACSAAHILLCLGPGPGDLRSVGVLARHRNHSHELPRCLMHRFDLAPVLLLLPGAARSWGFTLAAQAPDAVAFTDLKIALEEPPEDAALEATATALAGADDPRLGAVIARLFAHTGSHRRHLLAPAIHRHATAVREALPELRELDPGARVALAALLEEPTDHIVSMILELPPVSLPEVLEVLDDRPDVVADLPWQHWLDQDPSTTSALLATALERCRVPEIDTLVERALELKPDTSLIRATATLDETVATRLLASLLDHPSQMVRVLALDTLGNVGGSAARSLLRHRARFGDPGDAQVALRALARNPDQRDLELFAERSTDCNPAVRLVCAEALARRPDRTRLAALVTLAGDVDERVAARAASGLATLGDTR